MCEVFWRGVKFALCLRRRLREIGGSSTDYYAHRRGGENLQIYNFAYLPFYGRMLLR
ncbi:hypothetical protein GCM10023262_11530 [Bartonella pachyuromydis]|uniref:Uncharacterized protein n=1 Tax=Bartonella pachyuromydis TaxID=931097 RepID=A0ABP8VL74_9HYPH